MHYQHGLPNSTLHGATLMSTTTLYHKQKTAIRVTPVLRKTHSNFDFCTLWHLRFYYADVTLFTSTTSTTLSGMILHARLFVTVQLRNPWQMITKPLGSVEPRLKITGQKWLQYVRRCHTRFCALRVEYQLTDYFRAEADIRRTNRQTNKGRWTNGLSRLVTWPICTAADIIPKVEQLAVADCA